MRGFGCQFFVDRFFTIVCCLPVALFSGRYDVDGRRIDAAYHWSIQDSDLYIGEVTCPLENATCSEESMKDMAGGWFDAGDYSKCARPCHNFVSFCFVVCIGTAHTD